ncbi:MAG: Lrp/AsnC family transcriptional regulator [Pontixanthobacter sp.]
MSNNGHQPLDAVDRRILRELQADARRSPDVLADKAGISASGYRRRVKRLRETGVIQREVALLDPSRFGIQIIVTIVMMEEQADGYDRLKRRFRSAEEVSQCYTVTGEADLILHVHMPDMHTFEKWIHDYILSDPAVRRCTSNVVYSQIKFETFVPV